MFLSSPIICSILVSLFITCSADEISGNNRFLSDTEAVDGSAPHQVALFKDGKFHCSGSLISNKTVLTAANCIYGDTPSRFFIRYGSLALNNGTKVAVSSITQHPNYTSSTYAYDLAILHLAKPIIMDTNTDVISLASETPENGTLLNITGFGLPGIVSISEEHLQMTGPIEVMRQEECEAVWSNAEFGIIINERVLCLSYDTKVRAMHESGGPLVHNGSLVGIASFIAFNRTDYSIMNGYMNVVSMREWIEGNMNSPVVEDVGSGSDFLTFNIFVNSVLVFVSFFVGKGLTL